MPPPKPAPIVPIRGRFHHVKEGCVPCVPAAEFFKLYGNSLECPIEDCEYATFDEAADNGVGTVPSLELIDRQGVTVEWMPFAAYSGRDREGKQTCGHKDPHWFCPACINRKIRDAKAKAVSFKGVQPVAAKPARLPFRNQVRQAFDVLSKAKIGKFSIAHHCDDGDRVLRVMGRNKSKPGLLAVCGRSGHVEVTAPGSLIPDGKLGFRYRIYSETRVGIDPDEVIIDWGTPKAAVSQQACGFGLEVLGLIGFIGGLMQSNVEVTLPKDIAIAGEVAGGKVAAAFKEHMAPFASLHVSTWWEQRAYFTTVDASDVDCVVKTNGRWPLPKKQVFAWE